MTIRILTGDCREILKTLPDASVQCVVTSPPYYGLRDYGVDSQIGLEETPDDYVWQLVSAFREIRRALRDDGTIWLNIGDSYAGSWGAQSREHAGKHAPNASALSANQIIAAQRKASHTGSIPAGSGLKPKDMMGIPWLVAFALRADGWYLRSDIIWHKVAPMPESVRDRPTRSHEHVFLLTKSERYFYDAEAARDPLKETSVARLVQSTYDEQAGSDRANGGAKTNGKMKAVAAHFGGRNKSQINDQTRLASGNEWYQEPNAGANWRDVWSIASEGFREAHFAVMPAALAERCVRAGSKEGDTVLDPFAGAFTTALVADRLQRHAIGIELNPTYCDMARRRIEADAGMFAEVS